jgi:Spy/CpxP family protein refolding chaperone
MATRLNWTRILLGLGGALAVAGLVSFGVAYAETPQGPPAGPPAMAPGSFQMMPFGRIFRQLGVTADQRQQIRAILETRRADLKPLRDQALAARRGLADAIAAPAVNEQAIREASAKLAAVQADLAVLRARVRAEVFQVLTPEQREKALELEKQARERLGSWRQSRDRRGGL